MLQFSTELKVIVRLGQLGVARRKVDDNKSSNKKRKTLVWKCVAVFVKIIKLDLELGSWLTWDEPKRVLLTLTRFLCQLVSSTGVVCPKAGKGYWSVAKIRGRYKFRFEKVLSNEVRFCQPL